MRNKQTPEKTEGRNIRGHVPGTLVKSRAQRPVIKPQSLEYELTEILSHHVNEGGRWSEGEGAADVLRRIISERDRAMNLLALDRINSTW
jgi:hypothetical protein